MDSHVSNHGPNTSFEHDRISSSRLKCAKQLTISCTHSSVTLVWVLTIYIRSWEKDGEFDLSSWI